jgi:type 1 glutamine amidotransferase
VFRIVFFIGLILSVAAWSSAADAPADTAKGPKKIVLIAGRKSHGPEGNRIHDYPWSARLIKVMLERSDVKDLIHVDYFLDGWPADQSTIEKADTLMVISDGRDGDQFTEAPHLESDDRVALVEKQMKRGCGLVTFHFSTFTPDKYADSIFRWTGGYFDWEENGKRQWYSGIKTADTEVKTPSPEHAILRGVRPFKMNEEFYFNIRFSPEDKTVTNVFEVPALGGRPNRGNVVAWAKQRIDGGRGFGTTCGHYYDNWKNDDFRKTILNAIVWTAHVEVPKNGVEAPYVEREEIQKALNDFKDEVRPAAKP